MERVAEAALFYCLDVFIVLMSGVDERSKSHYS